MKKIAVTQHAAERWRERVNPGVTLNEAKAIIEELWPRAARRRERTSDGAERWRIDEPLAEILVRQERGEAVAVSVLGPEEIERMEREAEAEAHEHPTHDAGNWPPFGELTIVVKIEWELKGGTRADAEESIARCIKRKIRELAGTSTGNAVVDAIRIEGG